jgi:hypothetical protein
MLHLLLTLLLAAPSGAAPPVERPRGSSGAIGFAPAAAALGVDDWGDQGNSETTTHVMLSATRDAATLWIALPPDTSEDRASAWLQSLSAQLHWPSPHLALYPRDGTLLLKVESTHAPQALSGERSRLALDLPEFTRSLHQLSRHPILLAVRIPGATVYQQTPAPAVSGFRRGDRFLFYRLPAGGGSALQVDYGVPPRWSAAVVLSLLLWLLFPLLPALFVRYYALSAAHLKPDERLRLFDRCQFGGRVVAAAGFVVTLSALSLERTRYFGFNPWIGIPAEFALLLPYWPWCGGVIGLVRRSLSQQITAAGLVVRNNPLLEFGSTVVLLGIVLGPGLIVSQFGARAGLRSIPVITNVALVVLGLLMLAYFAPRMLRKPQRILGIRFDKLPNDPEELRALLRLRIEEAAREAEATPLDPKLAAARKQAVAVSPVAQAVLALEPDQQVALSASYHLVERRFLALNRLQCNLFLVPLVSMIGVSLWGIVHPLPGMAGVVLPLSFSVIMGSGKFIIQTVGRRITRHCSAADLHIAQALDQPHRFVDALCQLEHAERAAYAAAGMGSPTSTGFEERRLRLEQHLSLG